MAETFFAAHRLGDIARHCSERGLIGQHNPQLSNNEALRFGSNGSLKVMIAGPDRGTWYSHEMGQGGGVVDFLELFCDVKGKAAIDWLRDEMGITDNANNPGGKPHNAKSMGRIVATYDYQDTDGKLLFQVVRFADPKDFRQRQPDGHGGWVWNLKGVERVPYHLPDLGKGGRIYLVEGEKDADRLRADWGVVATTSPGGAGKWMGRWCPLFAGADVVIVPDNDEAGRKHAHEIANSLITRRHDKRPNSVRIVELSGLPEKGDISDALDQGLSQSEFEDLIDNTEQVVASGNPGGQSSASLFDAILAAEVDMRPVEWLWQGRLARGKLSLIAGHPGLGKSTTALDLAARISQGRSWPDGARAPQGSVLIFSLEDDPADTIVPRLVAAGADLSRITIVHGVPDRDEKGVDFVRPFSIRDDIDRLGQEVERLGDVVAIIVDPLNAYLGQDKDGRMVDSHNMAEVRSILTPLQAMAARLNVAVIGISHLTKSSEGEAVMLVSGSSAFVAAARACFFVMRDSEDPKRRLFLVAKNNLGDDTTGFAYRLKVHELETGPAVAVEWESDNLTRTADEEITERRAADKRRKDPNRLRLEGEFVKLELEFGPLAHNTLRDRAKEAGFSWAKVNTVLNELGAVRVIVDRNPDVWGWRLP